MNKASPPSVWLDTTSVAGWDSRHPCLDRCSFQKQWVWQAGRRTAGVGKGLGRHFCAVAEISTQAVNICNWNKDWLGNTTVLLACTRWLYTIGGFVLISLAVMWSLTPHWCHTVTVMGWPNMTSAVLARPPHELLYKHIHLKPTRLLCGLLLY